MVIGCFNSNKQSPELILTFVNESNNEINVTIIVKDSENSVIYNKTFHLAKAEHKITEKITDKAGFYNFYLYVDENRTIEEQLRINEEHFPPTFHIKNDEIQIGQKIV